jgi:NADH-quinone oxidoreductase subunit H
MQVLLVAFHILVFPGLLFEILMGILLLGTCNKLVARMQNRVGPPIIQPWYDFLKCCGKETIVPRTANRNIYLGIPYVGLGIILSTALFIPFAGMKLVSGQSDLIVILYLLTFVSVCMIIGAAASSSPWAGVGLSREMVAMISYELPFVFVILAVAREAGRGTEAGMTFSLADIVAYQQTNGSFFLHPALIPAWIAMLFVIPCEIGMHPFDVAEAETEICEGTLAEYSGKPLAAFKLTHCVKLFVMTSLFAAMFCGGINTGIPVLNVLIVILICFAVMFVSMALPHGACARFKTEQMFRFYWTFVSGIALVGLILVWCGF